MNGRQGVPTTPQPGMFVDGPDGIGQVDLVITKGCPPGDTKPVASPTARVRLWEIVDGGPDGVGWAPTQSTTLVPVDQLKTVPALTPARDPALPPRAVDESLVELVTSELAMDAPGDLPHPGGREIKQVYTRGLAAWPGATRTGCTAEAWALERVRAFLALARGVERPGYDRDRDLLPPDHPARTAQP